jgi:hypothetical protein
VATCLAHDVVQENIAAAGGIGTGLFIGRKYYLKVVHLTNAGIVFGAICFAHDVEEENVSAAWGRLKAGQ